MLCEAFSHDGSRAGEGERDPGQEIPVFTFHQVEFNRGENQKVSDIFPCRQHRVKSDYEVIMGSSWLHLDVGLSFCGTIIIS